MQELDKILEDIKEIFEDNKVIELNSDGTLDKCVIDVKLAWNDIKDIIRKHMNDGWIPVEDRLPEKNEYFVDTSNDNDFPNGYYRRFEIACMTDTIEYIHGYYDGYKWINKRHKTINNVLAWKIHEPYRPEQPETCKNNCEFASTEYFDYMGAEVAYKTAVEIVKKAAIDFEEAEKVLKESEGEP